MIKVLYILLLSFSISSLAQTKYTGAPNIRNYPKSEYNAGTQNWAISQDTNGFIYFANNDGLLSFNGMEWNLTRVSSSSPLRSILVDSKNSIYAGLINDFGIINREENTNSSFYSLKELLPEEYKEFDDIWRIFEIEEGVVFQCYKYIFLYKNNRIEVIEPENRFHFSFKIGNRLLIHEQGVGLFEFRDGILEALPWWQQHSEKEISTILGTEGNNILIGTANNGIYILEDGQIKEWNTPANEYVIKNKLYCATILPGNYYAFGTILKGLVISDKEGNIVHILDNNMGIQNNTVLSLYLDRAGHLWLGLDNGIDYIETGSPLSYIGSKKIGTGYCCKVFEGNLYLGTNQGLYVTPFESYSSTGDFVLVENTAGQVWTLEEFDGELICGHNLGTFKVSGRTALKISNEEGAWKYIVLKDNPGLLLGGHYEGLVLLKKENNEWKFSKKIKGFEESTRYLVQDENGKIWIGHGGKGVFQVSLNKDLDSVKEVVHYTNEHDLPSKTDNILFQFKKNIYVSTNAGIFHYDKTTDSFIPSEELNNLFVNSGKVKTIVADDIGNYWYIAAKESGVIHQNEDMSLTIINIPFKKLNKKYVNEFEFIYPYDNENIFLAVEDGFVHYSSAIPKAYKQSYKSFITKIEFPYIDSTLYFHSINSNITYKFPYKKNSFRFHFATPYFENEVPLQFSYFLEGFSEKWSEWSNENYKDYMTLRDGKYQLKLKAKNIYDFESEPASFTFEISSPWYKSNQAYFVYILLLLLLPLLVIKYMFYRINQSKLKEEQRHQEELQTHQEKCQHQALIAEKEIIELRNEKLRVEMIHHDKELANQTMGIIQKNKFLIKVNEDLLSIQDFIVNDTAKSKIYSLKKRIKKEIDIKQQNKIFQTYFDEAHQEFFKQLKEKYPNLTPNDLRLCAFIRMNISSKEIASILNISYRGVEVSRYRLRKKMELPRIVNLSSYLAGI